MNLPKSCEVEALAEWLTHAAGATSNQLPSIDDESRRVWMSMARAVRALLEAKVREACLYAAGEYDVDALREDVDSIVSHAMGAP